MKSRILLLAALAALAVSPAHASMELAKKARCVACHKVDQKLVGPAYRDVAEKYKGQAGAPAMLFAKVRAGGTGVWGNMVMTPNGPDKISDEDLKKLIDWILAGAQ